MKRGCVRAQRTMDGEFRVASVQRAVRSRLVRGRGGMVGTELVPGVDGGDVDV